MNHRPTTDEATEIVVSFAPTDDRTAEALDAASYRSYLRRTRRGDVSVGDEWAEFVNCGCGSTRDVVLRVESVDGGESIGTETAFVFEPRFD